MLKRLFMVFVLGIAFFIGCSSTHHGIKDYKELKKADVVKLYNSIGNMSECNTTKLNNYINKVNEIIDNQLNTGDHNGTYNCSGGGSAKWSYDDNSSSIEINKCKKEGIEVSAKINTNVNNLVFNGTVTDLEMSDGNNSLLLESLNIKADLNNSGGFGYFGYLSLDNIKDVEINSKGEIVACNEDIKFYIANIKVDKENSKISFDIDVWTNRINGWINIKTLQDIEVSNGMLSGEIKISGSGSKELILIFKQNGKIEAHGLVEGEFNNIYKLIEELKK